ncbi:MAG: N-acetyltransferase [Rhodospirillales bacterium]|nr:N-acetyltransferase [Rhodospirillales bacterium]
MTSAPGLVVRDAIVSDVEMIRRIYAHYVATGLATFEETTPPGAVMAERWRAVRSAGLPYLVAECKGDVVGYCYAAAYRSRSAYRFTVEDSVYVADGLSRRGVGRALLSTLIARCEAGPWRQMVAVIGDSNNTASISLHTNQGFRPVGTLNAVGFKLNRWVDCVLMQRALGEAASTPPKPGSAVGGLVRGDPA